MAVEGIKFTVDVSRINQMIKDLSLTNREAKSAIRRGLAPEESSANRPYRTLEVCPVRMEESTTDQCSDL